MNGQETSNSPESNTQVAPVAFDVHQITTQQLQMLGLSRLSYVRRVRVNDGIAYGIFAADGTPMGVAPDVGSAVDAIHEHNMAAALVH